MEKSQKRFVAVPEQLFEAIRTALTTAQKSTDILYNEARENVGLLEAQLNLLKGINSEISPEKFGPGVSIPVPLNSAPGGRGGAGSPVIVTDLQDSMMISMTSELGATIERHSSVIEPLIDAAAESLRNPSLFDEREERIKDVVDGCVNYLGLSYHDATELARALIMAKL